MIIISPFIVTVAIVGSVLINRVYRVRTDLLASEIYSSDDI